MNLKNIPGKWSKRKFVIIECDDWGSIRMPSINVLNQLLKEKILSIPNTFDYDTLADKKDLEDLFEVLLGVKDRDGNNAIITAFTNVANPDFRKIKESGFNEYFYEPFTETLKRYGRNPFILDTWRKGGELGIFIPEFHGRNHVSVLFWLQKLREGNEIVIKAFDHEFISVSIEGMNKALNKFRPEFYFNKPEQIPFLQESIAEGIRLFELIFKYTPRVFVPSNGIFHPALEKKAADLGLKYLNVSWINKIPSKSGNLKSKYYRIGGRSEHGLTYYTRNCSFEPVMKRYKSFDLTLKQIEIAFKWNKPAIIGTHRVNFVGGIDKNNREKGLAELRNLLKKIITVWPEVEFIDSASYLNDAYEMR